MLDVHAAFKERNLQSKMLLQIHDELLILIPEHELEVAQKIVENLLSHVVNWTTPAGDVPLVVTTRVGHDWAEVSK